MLWLIPRPLPILAARSSLVVREGMVGCVAAVAPPTLQYAGRLLQRLLVEHVPGTVAGQGVLRVVQVRGEAQHDVEGGRIVAMAAGVPVQWLLVELAAIRLGTCRERREFELVYACMYVHIYYV